VIDSSTFGLKTWLNSDLGTTSAVIAFLAIFQMTSILAAFLVYKGKKYLENSDLAFGPLKESDVLQKLQTQVPLPTWDISARAYFALTLFYSQIFGMLAQLSRIHFEATSQFLILEGCLLFFGFVIILVAHSRILRTPPTAKGDPVTLSAYTFFSLYTAYSSLVHTGVYAWRSVSALRNFKDSSSWYKENAGLFESAPSGSDINPDLEKSQNILSDVDLVNPESMDRELTAKVESLMEDANKKIRTAFVTECDESHRGIVEQINLPWVLRDLNSPLLLTSTERSSALQETPFVKEVGNALNEFLSERVFENSQKFEEIMKYSTPETTLPRP